MDDLDQIAETYVFEMIDIMRDLDSGNCSREDYGTFVGSVLRSLQRDTLAAVLRGAQLEPEAPLEGATVGRARVEIDEDGGVSLDVARNRAT